VIRSIVFDKEAEAAAALEAAAVKAEAEAAQRAENKRQRRAATQARYHLKRKQR
jgi:hypothetical protein